MLMASPTSRTLALFRSLGFECGVVERYNSFTKQRTDLAGCIDLLAWKEDVGIIGIQACAGASHAARRTKAVAEPRLETWIRSGGRFEVVSWLKMGGRGKRKLWQPRRDEVKLVELI